VGRLIESDAFVSICVSSLNLSVNLLTVVRTIHSLPCRLLRKLSVHTASTHRNSCIILVRNQLGIRPLGRSRRRQENNIVTCWVWLDAVRIGNWFYCQPTGYSHNQFLTRYWFTLLKSSHANTPILSVVVFTYYLTGDIQVSLNHTLPILPAL
jgi:hypothetical protein